MDENKDILTAEGEEKDNDKGYDLKNFEDNTTNGKGVDSSSADFESVIDELTADEESDDFSESEEEVSEIENFSSEPKSEKQPVLQKTIIISIIILLAFLATFFVVKCFFNNSIVGTWVLQEESTATADEAGSGDSTVYYTFREDGTVEVQTASVKSYYTYSIGENEDGQYVVSGVFGSVAPNYTVTGNEITGRTLVATYDGTSIEFKSASAVESKLDVPKTFEANDKIVGKWYDGSGNIDEEYYYYVYDFKADGRCTVNAAQYDYYTGELIKVVIEGVYTFDGDNITISYNNIDSDGKIINTDEVAAFALDESGDVLVLNGLGYYRVNDDYSYVSTPDEV